MANINLTTPGFLKSTRFWKLVSIAVLWILLENGAIVDPEVVAGVQGLSALLLGSITLRTVDRFSEKIGK